MSEPIADFRGQYAFLSNFFPVSIEMDGAEYPTIEHAFQAAKTLDFDLRRRIRNAGSPSTAKQMGRKLKRREDWFEVSLHILESLVRHKFMRYPDLQEKLVNTGHSLLIEGNNWNDRFYGCVYDIHQNEWIGENHLGKILMKIREEIQDAL